MLGVLPAASVRDYAHGDSMRHIHWPSTAHRSQLMVKELELEPSGDVWIVLNLHGAVQRGDGRGGTLEYAIILAASMAAEMVSGRERRAVGLLTASGNEVVALAAAGGPGTAVGHHGGLGARPADSLAAGRTAAPQHERTGAAPHVDRHHACRACRTGHLPPRQCCLTCGPRHRRPDGSTGSGAVTADSDPDAGGDWIPQLVQAQRVGLASSVLLVAMPEDEPAAVELVRRLVMPSIFRRRCCARTCRCGRP